MREDQFTNFPGFIGIRAGNKNGGEFHGKCPANGPDCVDAPGTNRFIVWPHQGDTGMYRCRKCGCHGDAIQFLRDFHGHGYIEACSRLGIEPQTKIKTSVPGRACRRVDADQVSTRAIRLHQTDLPARAWIEHAEKFVAWCHDQLLANADQLAYLAARGIGRKAVVACRLGWNPAETYRAREAWGLTTETNKSTGKPRRLWLPAGLVIPVYREGILHRLRIRRTREERSRQLADLKYYRIPGSVSTTMLLGETAKAFAIVEAELDAIAIFTAAGDLVGAVSIETLEGNLDADAAEKLSESLAILIALDADDPKTPALQRAVAKWKNTYRHAIRWPVPAGKDPGEAAEKGEDLRLWVLAGLPPVFHLGVVADHGGQSVSSGLSGGKADVSIMAGGEEAADAGQAAPENEAVATFDTAAEVESDVEELARLLQAHPVKLVKDGEGGVAIKWDRAWRAVNLAAAQRISDLVFLSAECGRHIDLHPALNLHGRNFCTGGWVGNG